MHVVNRNLESIKGLFMSEQISFVMQSIVEGSKQADVIVNDILKPHVAMIWDRNHCLYINFEQDIHEVDDIDIYLKNCILTPEVRQQTRVMKLYISDEESTEMFIEKLKDFKPKILIRSLYKYDLGRVNDGGLLSCNNLIIKEIDKDLMNQAELKNQEFMLDEIIGMWGSTEAFFQYGFGFYGIIDQEVVSWCTSEYNSKLYCGIGIETIKEYQGRGIAKIITQSFINKCKDKMITPYWDCWKDNLPSVMVAEKSGFIKVKDY